MKSIILAVLLLLPFSMEAKKLYVEMEFSNNSIKLDDGTKKNKQAVKDKNGKDLKFTSVIGALNYMSLQGWELIETKSMTLGYSFDGTGESETKITYIFCKEVPDSELEEVVSNSFKE